MRGVWFALALIVSLTIGASASVWAAVEARCTELGSNCHCSAPMQTNTFTRVFNGPYLVPSDSLTKPCTISDPNFTGGLIERNSNDVATVTSGEIITALPAGHMPGIQVVQTPTGGLGIYNIGLDFTRYSNVPTARRAIRMYVYYSPTFTFTDGNLPDCGNSGKLFQLSYKGGGIVSFTNGKWNTHAWGFDGTIWSVPTGYDCCETQPGQDANSLAMNRASFRGKWFSFEAIYRNLPGPNLVIEIYIRNITDNGPEIRIMKSDIPQAQVVGDQWTTTQYATTLSLTSVGWTHVFDLFRNVTASPHDNCSGYYGYTHYMVATWNTDAGQRIGPATEVEGGGGTGGSNTNFGTIAGTGALTGQAAGRVLGTLLTPRPAISVQLGSAPWALLTLLVLALISVRASRSGRR